MIFKKTAFILFSLLIASQTYAAQLSEEAITVFPPKVNLWNMSVDTKYSHKIFIRQLDKHSFNIKNIQTSGEHIQAKVLTSGGKEHKTYSIGITVKAIQPGPFDSFITIETDHPAQKFIKIPVTGNVLDNLTVSPQILTVPMNYKSRLGTALFKVTSSNGQKFKIEEVTASYKNFKNDVQPITTKGVQGYWVRILISDPEKEINRPRKGTIHVKTDLPQGMIIVPMLIQSSSI